MRVLSVIIGILMLICGVSCMCTPLVTFMDAGYFIVIMVAVYGVIGIVRAIAEKHFGAGRNRQSDRRKTLRRRICVQHFERDLRRHGAFLPEADAACRRHYDLYDRRMVCSAGNHFCDLRHSDQKGNRLQAVDFAAYFRNTRRDSRLLFLLPPGTRRRVHRIPDRLLLYRDRLCHAIQPRRQQITSAVFEHFRQSCFCGAAFLRSHGQQHCFNCIFVLQSKQITRPKEGKAK